MLPQAYPASGRSKVLYLTVLAGLLIPACQGVGQTPPMESSIEVYRDRMIVRQHEEARERRENPRPHAVPVAWQQELPRREALLAQPEDLPAPRPEEVLEELPDPAEAPARLQARLQMLREGAGLDQQRVLNNFEKVVAAALENLARIRRPVQLELTLAQCIQLALEHNYLIRIESYNPAISQTQVVEAEAAFDAEFFLEGTYSLSDAAVASQLQATNRDTRTGAAGFRQLLPTGMRVSTSLNIDRTSSNFQFQTLNPAYSTNFIVQFTQPLLRGVGLEYNRSQIKIRKAEWDISYEEFIQRVRDTLLDVEQAYWRLMQARRTAVVLAEQVAQNKATYENMFERLEHDATEVEVEDARSRWLTRQVEFQETLKEIRDAEDQLKNLLNDPELLLSKDVEIIPVSMPFLVPLAIDQLEAVRTALDSRSEINIARRRIDQARIGTAVAKNETLPQLDLSFQYEVQGVGGTADNSFDQLTTNRFISYTVQAVFSMPIGNRGPRAALRRARLQESQLVVGFYQVTDAVVQEVNTAVRTLLVRHAQLAPQLEAVRSAERTLRAFQARAERVSPTYLDSELSAVERLGAARRTLLQVVTEYNIAVAGLEAAKGTLLEYNNVVIADAPPPVPN